MVKTDNLESNDNFSKKEINKFVNNKDHIVDVAQSSYTFDEQIDPNLSNELIKPNYDILESFESYPAVSFNLILTFAIMSFIATYIVTYFYQ